MTLEECYEKLCGDYQDVIARLRSERLIQKFVLKFLDDPSYSLLLSSLGEKNFAEAFRAAHTIKGMCQNLGFTRLGNSGAKLTEALRGGNPDFDPALLEAVKEDYRITCEAVSSYKASLGV